MRTMRRGWVGLVLCTGFMFGVSIAAEKTETPMDREARTQAARFYAKHLTKCGEDHYFRWLYGSLNKPFLVQYHGLTVMVRSDPLTTADRLNGVEWSGESQVNAEAYRVYDEMQH